MAGILPLVLNYSRLGFPLLHIQLSISTQYTLWYFTIKGDYFGGILQHISEFVTSRHMLYEKSQAIRGRFHDYVHLCSHLLVNMRLKKWLAAANTTLWAGKCFPWTTRVTSQRVPWRKTHTQIRKHQDVGWLTHIVHTCPVVLHFLTRTPVSSGCS